MILYQGDDVLESMTPRSTDLLGSRPVVLNFWASECAPCRAEMPDFQKVSEEYAGRVFFFGLDIGTFTGFGGPDDSMRELADLGITYPAGRLPNYESLNGLQVLGLPSTFFVTPSGDIQKKWTGSLSKSALIAHVDSLIEASS